MSALRQQIDKALRTAVVAALGDEHAGVDPLVQPAKSPKFGDFQANLAMALGKRVGQAPREVAQAIVEALPDDAPFSKTEIAGPGFINLTLDDDALADCAAAQLADERLGVPAAELGKVVIDYGSPNLAKEMHIGHLRSSIIGDALARVLGYLGHPVTRANHVGDWGTQFGMLLEHLIDEGWTADEGESRSISDLNAMYQAAKQRDDEDEAFAARARERVAKLQAGDEESLAIWRQLTAASQAHMYAVYDALGVLIDHGDYMPESFYNDQLPAVCDDLQAAKVAVESDGALASFLGGDQEADSGAMIVRKSDGGYGYATTDLAAIRYRVGELGARRVIYVVDARQSEHFKRVFDAVERAGWADGASLEHVAFGTILGKDGKPFKTREGGTVRLMSVLDEALERARQVVAEKNPDLPDAERDDIASAVGVGALKYADLANDRMKDYKFDWDRMLSFEGNTAPYLINAYVRTQSLFRRAEARGIEVVIEPGAIVAEQPAERALILQLDRFGHTLAVVSETLKPHTLCTYLYELAGTFHRFWETCPVLRDDVPEPLRASRLALTELVARVLAQGLELLGIRVVERM